MKNIVIKKDGHLLLIGLDRSDKMNAFTPGMLRSLSEAFTILEEDKKLRCGLLYAKGDHFTAGLDLAQVGPEVGAGKPLFEKDHIDPLQTSGRKRTKPIVMAVKGYCLTIGMELVLANDITVAHRDTKFGQIEIKRGIFPFGGATVRMPQRCGWGNAMRYLLTGDIFSGKEAYRIGMVQEITDDDPYNKAKEIARTIADQAPLGVQASLQSSMNAIQTGEESALKQLLPAARELMQTEDAQEGLVSFVERRKANFKGQ